LVTCECLEVAYRQKLPKVPILQLSQNFDAVLQLIEPFVAIAHFLSGTDSIDPS